MANDPMDDPVRRTVGSLPVPAGLEVRIRASVARRRRARWAAVAAAALVGVGAALVWPRPRPVEPGVSGPVLLISEPVPPLEMRGVQLSVEARATGEGLAVRFLRGGPSDE